MSEIIEQNTQAPEKATTSSVVLTRKSRIRFFIPFIVISCLLADNWIWFLTTDYNAMSSHYIALILWLPIVFWTCKKTTLKKAIVATGIYLILATIGLLSLLRGVDSGYLAINVGGILIPTPSFNPPAMLLLIAYGFLNFDILVEIYLDYKEAKSKTH